MLTANATIATPKALPATSPNLDTGGNDGAGRLNTGVKFIYHNHICHKNIDTNKQCAKILRMSRLKAMTFIWYLGRIVRRKGNFSRVNVVETAMSCQGRATR